MIDLLQAGGLLFTVPLTVLAVLVLILFIRTALVIQNGRDADFELRSLFHVGLFSFFVGILGQAIGLYQMLGVVESVGAVSPSLLAGGLKVSSIAPLYGLIILVVALAVRSGLDYRRTIMLENDSGA